MVDPAAADPWARPTRPVDTLTGVVAGPYESRRVHVRGVVTYHAPDGRLWIADDTGGVEVRVAEAATPLAAGTEVDVLGFPVAGSYGVALADARYRVTGRHRVAAGRADLDGAGTGRARTTQSWCSWKASC